MPMQASPDSVIASIALSHCARAALAWEQRSQGNAVTALMAALVWAGRASHGQLPARHATDFLNLLRRPTQEWLPGSGPEVLLAGDSASDYAQDLVAEAGESPEAERVQEQVGQSRRVFATRPDGDAEYRCFRKFLIEHGHANRRAALDALMASGLAWNEVFEDIPASCSHRLEGQEVFYPCPHCRWPLPGSADVLECPAPICRQAGSQFRLTPNGLVALSGLPAPRPVLLQDQVRLRRGIWRYTLLPGLVELRLADQLARMGATVELWPERDRYDLNVQVAGSEWRVDVKDWSNGVALTEHLLRHESADRVCIVIPDTRSYQLTILRDRCGRLATEFHTASQFARVIQAAAHQQGVAL